jgi:hypothetical protein
METVKKLVKSYWKLIVGLLLAATAGGGAVKVIQGKEFEVIVVVPEDAPDIFNDGVPRIQAGPPLGLSDRSRFGLRAAALELRRRGEGRGKLFEVLKALHEDSAVVDRAEAAARGAGFDPAASIAVKVAIAVAIKILERTAPNTETTLDDRLLALLRLFEGNPNAVNAAHAAVTGG